MAYPIKVGNNVFQKIFEDDEIIVHAKFYWNTSNNSEVYKGHFRLFNKAVITPPYKIHNVFYCKNLSRLELRLSNHSSFQIENTIYDQDLDGMHLGIGEQEDYWFRISFNYLICRKKVCEEGTSPIPDDKDGSILIGTQ